MVSPQLLVSPLMVSLLMVSLLMVSLLLVSLPRVSLAAVATVIPLFPLSDRVSEALTAPDVVEVIVPRVASTVVSAAVRPSDTESPVVGALATVVMGALPGPVVELSLALTRWVPLSSLQATRVANTTALRGQNVRVIIVPVVDGLSGAARRGAEVACSAGGWLAA